MSARIRQADKQRDTKSTIQVAIAIWPVVLIVAVAAGCAGFQPTPTRQPYRSNLLNNDFTSQYPRNIVGVGPTRPTQYWKSGPDR